MPFHHGERNGQFIQIGNIEERIPIYPLNVFFILTDCGRDEEYAFPVVLPFNAAQILFRRRSAVAIMGRLAVGDKDQDFHFLPSF